MLAPEEVFAPQAAQLKARTELTPAEKRSLRNKQKKAYKKQHATLDQSVQSFAKAKGAGGVKKQKDAALKSLVKTGKGVTVIGKKSKENTKKA
jgi:U3 small nucleolar RNA-associated protein MPP10